MEDDKGSQGGVSDAGVTVFDHPPQLFDVFFPLHFLHKPGRGPTESWFGELGHAVNVGLGGGVAHDVEAHDGVAGDAVVAVAGVFPKQVQHFRTRQAPECLDGVGPVSGVTVAGGKQALSPGDTLHAFAYNKSGFGGKRRGGVIDEMAENRDDASPVGGLVEDVECTVAGRQGQFGIGCLIAAGQAMGEAHVEAAVMLFEDSEEADGTAFFHALGIGEALHEVGLLEKLDDDEAHFGGVLVGQE